MKRAITAVTVVCLSKETACFIWKREVNNKWYYSLLCTWYYKCDCRHFRLQYTFREPQQYRLHC